VQPLPVVEDLDVVGDGEACLGLGRELVSVVHLVLQRGEERFGGGVVPADTGPSDAGTNPVVLAVLAKLGCGVLDPAVGMVGAPPARGTAGGGGTADERDVGGFNDRYKDEVISRWGERAFQVSNDWWHGKAIDQLHLVNRRGR
jgi:hypothetical protein